MQTSDLLSKLGDGLINSPFLSIDIVDKDYRVIWHNQRYADEFNGGKPVVNKLCFEAAGFEGIHEGCPNQKAIRTGKPLRGYLDFGDRNMFFLSIPLDEEHAAEVHFFLPKEPDGITEEWSKL